MIRTFNEKEVSLEELFKIFHRFCKVKNIPFQTKVKCGKQCSFTTFDLNAGLGNWISCTISESQGFLVDVLCEFLQHYESANLNLVMENVNIFLTENNIQQTYEDYLINNYKNQDPCVVMKFLACMGIPCLINMVCGNVPNIEGFEPFRIWDDWMNYAHPLKNIIL